MFTKSEARVVQTAAWIEPQAGVRLAPGDFVGVVRRRIAIANLVLAEVQHDRERALPRHVHADSYFCLLLSGAYQDAMGRQTRTMRPLAVTYSPAEMEHTDRVGQGGARFFTLTVGSSVLRELGQRRDLWERPQLWDAGEVTLQLLRLFARFAREPETLDSLALEDRLSTVVGSVTPDGEARERRRPRWIDASTARLNDCLVDSPGVVELARDAGVHPVYLSRTFRRFIGYGPAEYRARARVAAACRLIAASDGTLAQVSVRTGFADQSHMTRVFAKVVGVTPAVYRSLIQ